MYLKTRFLLFSLCLTLTLNKIALVVLCKQCQDFQLDLAFLPLGQVTSLILVRVEVVAKPLTLVVQRVTEVQPQTVPVELHKVAKTMVEPVLHLQVVLKNVFTRTLL